MPRSRAAFWQTICQSRRAAILARRAFGLQTGEDGLHVRPRACCRSGDSRRDRARRRGARPRARALDPRRRALGRRAHAGPLRARHTIHSVRARRRAHAAGDPRDDRRHSSCRLGRLAPDRGNFRARKRGRGAPAGAATPPARRLGGGWSCIPRTPVRSGSLPAFGFRRDAVPPADGARLRRDRRAAVSPRAARSGLPAAGGGAVGRAAAFRR